MPKHAPPPTDCAACAYWFPWPNGNVGRCHCVLSDKWNHWTIPTTSCPHHDTEHDASIDSREEASWSIMR
jgi:hypothetical protein